MPLSLAHTHHTVYALSHAQTLSDGILHRRVGLQAVAALTLFHLPSLLPT